MGEKYLFDADFKILNGQLGFFSNKCTVYEYTNLTTVPVKN